uniref:Uncharacterized protein n=1 Tax=Oryza barthii TaxID=65489 RepID=A0A0D3HAS2_9ORYZ
MDVALRTAGWLVGKLVNLLSAELLEALENSYNLGANAHAIKAELLYTQGLLHRAQGRNVTHSPELAGLLLHLTHLAEDADNVFDKVDYYRIRDDAKGAPAGSSVAEFFNRSTESERIKSLMAHMQPLCAKISNFLKLEVMDAKHRTTALNNTAAAFNEHVVTTTSTSLVAKLHGRFVEFYATSKEITCGRDGLTVLPVLGPGGIGKTTFTQHLFHDQRVKKHFHVRIWAHVSLNFDVLRLTKEIFDSIVTGEVSWGRRPSNEKEPRNLEKLHKGLQQMLQFKRFLLVLDDMWSCDNKYKWDKFLNPFRKTRVKDGLDLEAFWACAFGDEKPEHHKELLDLGREIVKKPGYSPLAVKTVVKTRAEAEKAKLKLKRNLVRLKLVWDEAGSEQTEEEANSIEGLQPPANIRELCIKNHKGITCPSWFHSANSFKALEILHLHGVSWNIFPPFGQIPYLRKLKLENIAIENFEVRDESLENLRSIEFIGILSMKTWVCSSVPLATLQKLTSLEALVFEDCSSLSSGRRENGVIQISIRHLVLRNYNITGKELSDILACYTCLSHLEMEDCNGITGLSMQQSDHEMDGDGNDVDMLQFPSKLISTLSRLGIFSKNHLTLNVNSEVLGKLTSLQWLQLGGCVLSCAAMQAVDDDLLPLANNLKVLRVYGYDKPD